MNKDLLWLVLITSIPTPQVWWEVHHLTTPLVYQTSWRGFLLKPSPHTSPAKASADHWPPQEVSRVLGLPKDLGGSRSYSGPWGRSEGPGGVAGLLEWTWLPWLPGDVLNIPVPESTEVHPPWWRKSGKQRVLLHLLLIHHWRGSVWPKILWWISE